MKPRPTEADEDGGLDSLMDTMTNVVGILILVLVMTQLQVQDTLKQITESSTVTEEDLQAAKSQLEELKKKEDQLQNQVSSFSIANERERLKRMKEMLEAKKKLMEAEKKQANQYSMAIEKKKEMAAKKKKEIKGEEEKRDKLKDELTEALKEKAELQAKLAKTPQKPAPPPKIVSIPNPRPAPKGAKRLMMMCVNNRVYPMSVDDLRKDAEEKAKEIIIKHKLNLNPKTGIDPKKFEEYYVKLPSPPDRYFEVEYYVSGDRWPRIRLIPRKDRGGTDDDLHKSRSRIRKIFDSINHTKYYLIFYVLPDSYDVYITARQVAMREHIEAGWVPERQDWVYTTSASGGIELGPPRPPAPKPTTPPKPKKPANVID